ncbi:hypothetical protein VKT23_002616 [Stygiomarasmius scandens]|uniref:Major facilitator superfamily (MFS) profile domain-containing protein n=1 Tax=Marasmiellus scandens TaxID=2682957 RepID=A0ABR1K3P0_9AGAR
MSDVLVSNPQYRVHSLSQPLPTLEDEFGVSQVEVQTIVSPAQHASQRESQVISPNKTSSPNESLAPQQEVQSTKLVNRRGMCLEPSSTSQPISTSIVHAKSIDSMNDALDEADKAPTNVDSIEVGVLEVVEETDPRATGKIASWRGAAILATACFAQLLDGVWMSSINIAVPHIAEEFSLPDGSQSWLVSAYTLTFGGFLLLAGVLSDRFGRRQVFSFGMVWMSVFSVACGISRTGVQCIVFRALQGLGAAASVPSAIGVLSTFFVGNERHRALSLFGAAGALGFVVGLILGGLLSGTLGWRYVFYVNAPVIFVLAVSGWFSFPNGSENGTKEGGRPSLDFLGAALGTSGVVLMAFALSQSEISGWNKPVIIVTLILSAFILVGFAYAERKVPNPIMPMYLWKLPSFAGVWCAAFLLYAWWTSLVYYITLISQQVLFLSPLTTGIYLIPMGTIGVIACVVMGPAVEKFELKALQIVGLLICLAGTFPAAFTKTGSSFWAFLFPSTLTMGGTAISYTVVSIALVSAVPPAAKSMAGGLINTAFQIGSGFGFAITSLVNESVLKGLDPGDPSSIMKGYQAALFACSGLIGGSLILSVFTIRAGQQATDEMIR